MGGHYGSVQVRTEDRDGLKAVVESVCAEKKIRCLLGPVINGWVGIYPENNGQDDSVGAAIARLIDGHVLHLLVHDDDVLAYWLWRDHQLVDSYWSKPGYFGEENRAEEESRRGDPQQFRPIIGDKVDKLAGLLDRDNDYTFEYERLGILAKVLGIANAVTAYEYLNAGERTGIKSWRQFQEIPASEVVSEALQRREAKNRIKAERTCQLKAGVLLYVDERKDQGAIVCAADSGLIFVWPDYGRCSLAIEQLQSPWKSVQSAAIESPPHITAVASGIDTTRLVFAAGDRVRAWDKTANGWQHLLDVPEKDHAIGAAISPDGHWLAHASRNELVITNLVSGRQHLSVPRCDQQCLAIHPSGAWLTSAGLKLYLISLNEPPHQREIFVGGKTTPPRPAMVFSEQMRNIDVEELVAKQKTAFDAGIDKLLATTGKGNKIAFSAEQIEHMRVDAQKSIGQMRSNLEAMKAGNVPLPPGLAERANESVQCAIFSRDGHRLFCGTNAGLRVYDWDSFPRESGSISPSPVWQFAPPTDQEHAFHQQVNAIIEEPDGLGVVFGGWSGKIMRLDLSTGEVQNLISLPGGGGVHSLAISRGGEALAVSSSFSRLLNQGSVLPDMNALEVWAYPRLRESVAKLA